MKIRVQLPLEHGILFLYDPYSDPEIPKDTGASPVTSTDSCICFQVASYVDGDADVTLSDMPVAEGVSPAFSGRIQVSSKNISLTDVPGNYYCILKLKAKIADINIWNYKEDDIERSWIQINEIDLF
jgi:hypothetical protein